MVGSVLKKLDKCRLDALKQGHVDIAYGIWQAQAIIRDEQKELAQPDIVDDGVLLTTCPICGKRYARTPGWTYKIKDKKDHVTYYCRYKCFREAERLGK